MELYASFGHVLSWWRLGLGKLELFLNMLYRPQILWIFSDMPLVYGSRLWHFLTAVLYPYISAYGSWCYTWRIIVVMKVLECWPSFMKHLYHHMHFIWYSRQLMISFFVLYRCGGWGSGIIWQLLAYDIWMSLNIYSA